MPLLATLFLFSSGCTTQLCGEYDRESSEYGYCLLQHVETVTNISEIEAYCGNAGSWQQDCRQSWAKHNAEKYPLTDLINICGIDTDCAFEILDTKPDADVAVQIDRCRQYVYKYLPECVSHAMWRWYYTDPTAEEVARVAKIHSQASYQIGHTIAARVVCGGVGTCKGDQRVQRHCEQSIPEFQANKSRCPHQRHLFEKKSAP